MVPNMTAHTRRLKNPRRVAGGTVEEGLSRNGNPNPVELKPRQAEREMPFVAVA